MSLGGQQELLAVNGSRPFLKWAGGKSQILSEILSLLPEDYGRYYEPFLGGGAVFFGLGPPPPALLSDSNDELINTFIVVRDHVESLIESLRSHENTKRHFYEIRATNPKELSPVERASRMIYLNRTCFNGLYRVNQKGQFNTPYGGYKNPRVVRADTLRDSSRALQGHEIIVSDYLQALSDVERGDLVYLDPPYIPLGGYSDFKRYNKSPFGIEDHHALSREVRRLDAIGAWIVLSNSGAELARDLYAEWNVREIEVARRVSADPSGRAAVTELLVTNFA